MSPARVSARRSSPRAALAALLLAALAAACSPVGALETLGTVAERRGVSQIAVDSRIQDETTIAIARAGASLWRNSSVIVFLRRTLLTGVVPDEAARNKLIAIARGVEGVSDVLDGLIVAPPGGFSQSVDDGAIEASLKSRMIATAGVSSVDYRFRSFQGVLHIIGLAKDDGERRAVLNLARSIGGVRDVRDWVRVM